MKEWRRLKDSWPTEKARVADPDSLPVWIDQKVRGQEGRRETLLQVGGILSAFTLPMAASLLLMGVLAPDGTGPVAAALALSGVAVAFPAMFIAAFLLVEKSARRRVRRMFSRLEARGEGALGAEAVGVTYADARWRSDPFGKAWDWGALRVDFDRLIFVGEQSRFELRPRDIVGTEVRRLGNLYRLYVRYHVADTVATLGLDLPYDRRDRVRVEEVTELQKRIERWRAEPLPTPNAQPAILPSTEDVAAPKPPQLPQIGLPAKVIAGIATFVMVVGGCVSLMLAVDAVFGRGHRFGGFLAGAIPVAGMILWAFLAYKIETRLPARWRHREPEATLLTSEPPLVSRAEEERVNLRA